MKIKTNLKDSCFIFLVCILMISFAIIIYQNCINNVFEKELKKQRYEGIEEIRYRNESIVKVLEGCITSNKITNEELVILYKNYSEIANEEIELWQAYLDNKNRLNIFSKNKNNNIEVDYISEIYWDIEQLIYNYLKDDLRENISGMQLSGPSLADFSNLLYLAKDLNNYFVIHYDDNYSGLEEEEKMEKMMRNNNWISILNGIQGVSKKYIDYPFIYESESKDSTSITVTE